MNNYKIITFVECENTSLTKHENMPKYVRIREESPPPNEFANSNVLLNFFVISRKQNFRSANSCNFEREIRRFRRSFSMLRRDDERVKMKF